MRLAAAVLGLALGFAASGAQAADIRLITAFRSLCLDNRGDAAEGAAAALASGWRELPTTPAEAADGFRRYEKAEGHRTWTLLLENVVKPADSGIPMRTRRAECAVYRAPDFTSANAELRAYMGVEPTWRDGATWWWTYIDRGATREYIAATPQTLSAKAIEALKSGPWVVVMAGPRGPVQIMVFSRIVRTGP
jgi:hypothetical protein